MMAEEFNQSEEFFEKNLAPVCTLGFSVNTLHKPAKNVLHAKEIP
jgi:hypothetical protein